MLLMSCSRNDRSSAEGKCVQSWSPKNAAAYLDERENWWMNWPGAARDHDTFCISCHTAAPYALARPTLRKVLGETSPSVGEKKIVENVRKRVRLWNEVAPYYTDHDGDQKAVESRGTESVLNALILVTYNSPDRALDDDTKNALAYMWALQLKEGEAAGAWSWIRFGAEPWEADDSQYYGAALAAVVVGNMSEKDRSAPEIQNNLKLLQAYLSGKYSAQSTINRVVLLWASTRWPELLKPEQRESIMKTVLGQQQADGGWRLPPLVWHWQQRKLSSIARIWLRPDGTFPEKKSDGYATGLIAYVLQNAGVSEQDAHLQRALSWLKCNQNATTGLWPSYSPNRKRDLSSDVGLFMSDSATAYAVLALSNDESRRSASLNDSK